MSASPDWYHALGMRTQDSRNLARLPHTYGRVVQWEIEREDRRDPHHRVLQLGIAEYCVQHT